MPHAKIWLHTAALNSQTSCIHVHAHSFCHSHQPKRSNNMKSGKHKWSSVNSGQGPNKAAAFQCTYNIVGPLTQHISCQYCCAFTNCIPKRCHTTNHIVQCGLAQGQGTGNNKQKHDNTSSGKSRLQGTGHTSTRDKPYSSSPTATPF